LFYTKKFTSFINGTNITKIEADFVANLPLVHWLSEDRNEELLSRFHDSSDYSALDFNPKSKASSQAIKFDLAQGLWASLLDLWQAIQ
jgi:hypothetical protein